MIGMRRRAKIIPFPGVAAPPGPGPSEPEDERGLIEVRRCEQAEAMVVKSLLESEGIPTLLRSRFTTSLHPFTVGSQGEIVIFVPEAEAGRARALVVRLRAVAAGRPLK
jgi:Putative prokaryotic signal transducing protein